MRPTLPVIVFSMIFIAVTSFSATITVGSGGEDYSTITAALIAAESGDEVVVSPGTYAEQITLKVGVTLKSDDQGSDGYNDYFYKSGITVIDGGDNYPVVELADESRLEGFTITGGNAAGFAVHGYFVSAEVIGNRIISNAGGGLYLLGAGSIHKNLIAGNNGRGLELAYSTASVHFNSITNNTGDGIRVIESEADIQNNIIAGNGASSSGSAGIRCVGTDLPTLDYNNVWDNSDTDYLNCSAGANSISQDPLWDLEYRMDTSSPCYDAGFDLGDGYPVWDTAPDIGWFEYVLLPLPSMSFWGIFLVLAIFSGAFLKMKRQSYLALVVFGILCCQLTVMADTRDPATVLKLIERDQQEGVLGEYLDTPIAVRLVSGELLYPTDDTLVWEHPSFAGVTHGTCPRMPTGMETCIANNPHRFDAYLKFDVPAYTDIELAELHLKPAEVGNIYYCPVDPCNGSVLLGDQKDGLLFDESRDPSKTAFYLVDGSCSWDEDNLTWNNQPGSGCLSLIPRYSYVHNQATPPYPDTVLDLLPEVLSWAADPASNGGLKIINTHPNSPGNGRYYWTSYYTKEAGNPDVRPRLGISRASDSGVDGEQISFYVTDPYGSVVFNEQVTTADDGCAVWNQIFPTSPEGLYHFYISYPDADYGSPIEFDILFGNPVIEGNVTYGFPEDLPVPIGTDVWIYNVEDGTEFSVATDSNGFYTTTSHPLPFGTYYAFAEIDNCLKIIKTVEVDHLDVYERNLHIFCPLIHGKVMSPSGPVADATVTLNPGGETQFTTSEGDYVFVVTPTSLPESYTVTAEKDGYVAYPTIEYVTLTEDNPIGVANFCWTSAMDRGSPGDDYVYYPEHFSTPGFDPNHANLAGMPEETIDTFTGKVNLVYTDLSLPGKGGLDLNVIRTYSSCIKERSPWADDNIFQQKFVPETSLGLGWDINFGRILYRNSETPVIVMPDGSQHVAYKVPHSGSVDGYPKYTEELWRLEKVNSGGGYYDLLLTTTDGIQYYFDRSDFYTETDLEECWQKHCAAVSEIRSADGGNVISINYTTTSGRFVIDNVVDTYNRTVDFSYDPVSGFLTQITGPNNSVYLEYFVIEFGYGRNALQAFIARAAGPGSNPGDMQTTYSYDGEVTSPTFGVLTGMQLPTGGTITYTHEEHEFYLKAFDGTNVYDRTYVDLAITSREATGADVTTGTTTYNIGSYGPQINDQYTVVTDPLGNDIQYRYWNYYADDLGDIQEWKIGLPAEIIYYDGSASGGTAVKTETRTYESRRLSEDRELNRNREYVNIPVSLQVETTLHGSTKAGTVSKLVHQDSLIQQNNGLVISRNNRLLDQNKSRAEVTSRVESFYPGSDGDLANLEIYENLGMPSHVTEYDYTGTAARTTRYTYIWENTSPGSAAFQAANFLSGIYTTEIVDGDVGGTVKAKTENLYYNTQGNADFTRLQSVTQYADPGNPSTAITVSYDYYSGAGNAGNLYSITDAESKITTFDWDSGTISQIVTPQQLPDSSYMTFSQGVDADTGRVTSVTDPNGNVTSYTYDDLGRLTGITPPLDQTTNLVYDVAGGQVTSTQGSYVLTYNYDDLGRLIQTVVPGDQGGPSYINQSYDPAGNLNFVSEASFSSTVSDGTSYLYSALNRIMEASDPDGTTTYSYDGNVVEITRSAQVTTKTYDALSRLDQIEDADGKVFDYSYDILDNLTLVDHPDDVTCSDRVFVYDGLSRLTSETHPETGPATYTYYDSGQVETITKASGRMTSFVYDNLYRPVSKSAGSGADQIQIDYHYDGIDIPDYTADDSPGFYVEAFNHRTGAVVSKGDPLVEESFLVWPEFDLQGRNLTKDVNLVSPVLSASYYFGYDTLGNLNNIVYPSGIDVTYTYGAGTNLLGSISLMGSSGTQTLANGLLHNPAGGLEEYVFGNGVKTTISPDVRNRPSNWITQIGSDDLVNQGFGYDAFGNITGIGSIAFTYDNLNRIATAAGLGSRDFTYSYDSVGNILSVTKTNPSDTSNFTYAHNRINGVAYDADGNMTDDSTYLYTYDEFGKLIDIDSTVQYSYDGLDKRIKKTESGSTTVYKYLGEQLLSEYDSSSLLFFDNVYFEGQLLARVTDDGVSTDVVFAHLNHLGSPVAFTYDLATVVWPEQTVGLPYEIHEYEPFGADFDDLGSPPLSGQDVRYTGKLVESATQKHYFNARYLNAVTEQSSYELPPRFMSPDIILGHSINPQSWNRYSYVLNNPLIYLDPAGFEKAYFMFGRLTEMEYKLFRSYSKLAILTAKTVYGSEEVEVNHYATNQEIRIALNDPEAEFVYIFMHGAGGAGSTLFKQEPASSGLYERDFEKISPSLKYIYLGFCESGLGQYEDIARKSNQHVKLRTFSEKVTSSRIQYEMVLNEPFHIFSGMKELKTRYSSPNLRSQQEMEKMIRSEIFSINYH